MSVISLKPGQVAGELKARARKTPGEITKAMMRSARRAQAMLVRRTPKDLGQAKAGWKVSQAIKGTKGARIDVYNDNPYVGILERGARPHPVSKEGVAMIHAWVWRNRMHFPSLKTAGGNAKTGKGAKAEALNIAYAIAAKIKREGQKPKYFVKDSIPELQKDFAVELNKQIEAYSKRRAARGGKK